MGGKNHFFTSASLLRAGRQRPFFRAKAMQLGIIKTVKLNRTLATLGGMALVSCAAPKAVVIEAPAVPKKVVKAPQPVVEAPVPTPIVNEGLRMPDMLAMPTESEFRATNPTVPKLGNEAGAVIARPPKTAEP